MDDSGVTYIKVNNVLVKRRTGLTFGGDQPFKPIPITEAWLKMLGFKHYVNHSYAIGDFHYNLLEKTINNIVSESFKPEIKHVHQLQNLYTALTGKELIYNPAP